MMSSQAVARLDDLTVRTRHGGDILVDSVSLTIRRGERVALIGESGSGKSTVAAALMGLIPFERNLVASGTVWLETHCLAPNIKAEFQGFRGSKVALVAQEPMSSFNPYLTLGEQLDEVRQIHNAATAHAAKQWSLKLLSQVGLPEPERIWSAYPHMLSGGMLQRVAIAMAISAEPALLIADEPTTALDVTVQAQIIALLRQLSEERHMALLLISHDLPLCTHIAERVLVMVEGQVVETAPTRELVDKPSHPYTHHLVQAAREQSILTKESLVEDAWVKESSRPLTGCAFAARCPRVLRLCHHVRPPLAQKNISWVRCFNPVPPVQKVRRTRKPPRKKAAASQKTVTH